MYYFVPNCLNPADPYCDKCQWHLDQHTFDGIGWGCPAGAPTNTTNIPAPGKIILGGLVDATILPWAKPPVHERTCKRCGNKSLREVTKPDESQPVAFCRLCGHEEDI